MVQETGLQQCSMFRWCWFLLCRYCLNEDIVNSGAVVCVTDKHLSVNIEGDVDVARAQQQTSAVTGLMSISSVINIFLLFDCLICYGCPA